MLDELAVSNIGVIESAHLEPGRGLTVVTGETGTGKTLLLGALRLLMGEQARTDLIGPHGDEARVDGRFLFASSPQEDDTRADQADVARSHANPTDEREEVAIGRRIGRSRSRAYIDGAMAPARAVVARVADRVEIVGQHDQLLLVTTAELRSLLDRGVPAAVLDAYHSAWQRLADVRARVDALGGDRRALERELDLVSYQVEEIATAGFEAGEDEELAIAAARLRNAEELRAELGTAYDVLDEGAEAIGRAVAGLRRAQSLDASMDHLEREAESIADGISELLRTVREASEDLGSDPERLELVEERLALLGGLKRKYGATLDEVLGYADRTLRRRTELEDLIGGAGELDEALAEALAQVEQAGAALRSARADRGRAVAERAIEHLRDLGFDDPVLRFVVEPAEPAAGGAERISLEFSSDVRLRVGPISRVASGGELSRLVLSIRLAAGAGDAEIVAFDEIDAGVGGATALAMGEKLAALAQQRQVLCVTHLPQVAAFADTHYVVDRDGPKATVRVVEGDDDRLGELSRMLSGMPDSGAAHGHAQELRKRAIAARSG